MLPVNAMGLNYFVFVMSFAIIVISATDEQGIRERTPFWWRSCGDSSDPLKVGELKVYQNDSDYIYATGNFKVAFDLEAPIQGKVVMKKKVLGVWVLIPCCTYDDLCALSPYKADCPMNYTDQNLPCRCPIAQGKYAFEALPIDTRVLPKWLEKGLYSIKVTLNKLGKELICLKMMIDL